MALERENILSLIGKGRYHSCILTTFSFDFYFFEMKAMKWLRSCGIRNVNVLMDGYFYSELIKQATGDEMRLSPGYSLYPVFQKSIFHPKIWMLFGKNEGLLIIGSGNLTNSGNGNNDEIWGAFHFDIRSSENSSIFSSAWLYLNQLTESSKGIFKEKTSRWISEHSKWLNDLPPSQIAQFVTNANSEEVAILINDGKSTIWMQVQKLIGNENIIDITTISPFYDSNGKVILEMKSAFPNSKFNVVLYEKGLIPSAILENGSINFYDWKDAGLNKDVQGKLHAKIIHFKTKGDIEFCLFGSANVTPEGMGLSGIRNINSEACLFIKSTKGGLLDKLQIKLNPANAKKITDFPITSNRSIYNTIIKDNQYLIKLLSAELSHETLTLYLDDDYNKPCEIILYDKQNFPLFKHKVQQLFNEIELKLNIEEAQVQYVQLFQSESNVPISNKIIISDYFLVAKTHPNPKTEEIENIYSEIQNGELSKVLDLLHFAIIDEGEQDSDSNLLHNKKADSKKGKEDFPPKHLYDLSSYKSTDHGRSSFEKSLLLSPSLRILDILKIVHTKTITKSDQNDISVDEQLEDISNISGNEENEVRVVQLLPLHQLKYERKKLYNYFDSLNEYFHNLLYGEFKKKDYKPNLSDLTKYLIALELMIEYGGKSEKYLEINKQCFFSYLPYSGDYDYNNTNIKGCCLNLIGDFLMLSRTGFKEYEFEYTRKEIIQLINEASISTIICILNTNWKEDELPYLNTLLLNAMHCFGTRISNNFQINFRVFTENIKSKSLLLKQSSNHFDRNLNYFTQKICPAYLNTLKKRENKDFDSIARTGNIVYSSYVGYAFVQSTKTNIDLTEYNLLRPGFDWNEKAKDYLLESSIRIPKFILIDL